MSLLRHATFAVAVALPALAHAGCHIRTLELPVKMVGSRATTTIELNGTPVPLTVDSGAFFSFLTDAAAAQLQLTVKRNSALRVEGLTGRVDTRATTVDKVKLFNGEIEHVDFVVGGNEPGGGTMGLMGRNMLWTTDTEYDLAHGVVYFHFPNDDCAKTSMAYWAGDAPVTEVDLMDDERGKTPALRERVKLNGEKFVALFDTGATTTVSTKAATRAGIAETDLKPAGFTYGAGRGTSKLWTASFDRFELGGEAIRGNRLPVADLQLSDADLLLGVDFFLSHRIYFSKQQSKAFITYNGGAVFALDKPAKAVGETGAGAQATDEEVTTADAFARRGAALAARRDYSGALADLDQACELEPTSGTLFAQRAAVQQALKRPAKALEDVDRALELDATLDEARLRRAGLRFNAKDRDGAKSDLDALDRTVAAQAQVRLTMANLYLALEQPAQALAQFDRWLPAHPNEVVRTTVLGNRCRVRLIVNQDLDRAIDDCDEAIDGSPKNPVFLESRGWAYLRLGKYRKAIADFDRSIESRPTGATAFLGRGMAKARLGDAADGDVDLAAARKLQADVDVRVARAGLWTEPVAKP